MGSWRWTGTRPHLSLLAPQCASASPHAKHRLKTLSRVRSRPLPHNAHLTAGPAATLLRSDTPDTGSGMAEAVPAALREGVRPSITRGPDGLPCFNPMHLLMAQQTMPSDHNRSAGLAADGLLRPGQVLHHGTLCGSGLAAW